MFNKKLRNDIGSIKRSVAQILANTECLSIQTKLPKDNLFRSNIRDAAVGLVGKWVYVTKDVEHILNVAPGTYYILCVDVEEVALCGKKPFISRVNMFLMDINNCTPNDFEKDGVSLDATSITMNRTREVSISGEYYQEKVLTALNNNIITNLESLVMINV